MILVRSYYRRVWTRGGGGVHVEAGTSIFVVFLGKTTYVSDIFGLKMRISGFTELQSKACSSYISASLGVNKF